MFEDDTSISISGSSLVDLEQETNSELLNLHGWLKANKLSLNVAKTEFMVIGSRQKPLNLRKDIIKEINIKLEYQVISKAKDHPESLVRKIDNRLSWSNHVNELCKKIINVGYCALKLIRPHYLPIYRGTSLELL